MQNKYWALALLAGFSSATFSVHASEFDQYLQEKNIIVSLLIGQANCQIKR